MSATYPPMAQEKTVHTATDKAHVTRCELLVNPGKEYLGVIDATLVIFL